MKCSDFEDFLSAYANEELAHTQRDFVEAHLSVCNDCQKLLADYTVVRSQLAQLHSIRVTSDIKQATMSKIKEQKLPNDQPGKSLSSRPGSRFATKLKDLVGPVFRQPKWKIATIVVVVVLALITTLTVTLLPSNGKSDVALAEEIARNSVAFKVASFTEGETTVQRVDIQSDKEATVTFSSDKGKQIVADIDLEQKRLKLLELKFPGPELTEAEKTLAIEIAKADPRVIKILNQGMSIQMIFSLPLDGVYGEGKIIDLHLLPDKMLPDYLDENGCLNIPGKAVRVDIGARTVLSIGNGGITIPPETTTKVPELSEAEKTLAIEIAKADPRVIEFLNEGMRIYIVDPIPLDGVGKIIDVILWPGQLIEGEYVQGKYVRVDIGKRAVLSIDDCFMIVPPGFAQPE